jgi:hypothetical protein
VSAARCKQYVLDFSVDKGAVQLNGRTIRQL